VFDEDDKNVLGLVEVVYDTGYLFSMVGELWRRVSITLISLFY